MPLVADDVVVDVTLGTAPVIILEALLVTFLTDKLFIPVEVGVTNRPVACAVKRPMTGVENVDCLKKGEN